MISNVDELIEEANKIESTDDRAKFIMNYFLQNVKYNYANLFCAYLTQGLNSYDRKVKPNNIVENKTKKEGSSDFALALDYDGKSKIFENIFKIRDENKGNYNEFIENLREYVESELGSHLDNENIISENTELIIKEIEDRLGKQFQIPQIPDVNFNYDMSAILIQLIFEREKIYHPEFENGLITNGVCQDYTEYLVPLLEKAGIKAHAIEGTSELGHAWVVIKDDEGQYKSIDLTRAVFIRDGFKGIPENQTSQDWLYHDVGEGFKMQATRSITKIDGQELPIAINGENYNPDEFAKLVQEISRKKEVFNTDQLTPEKLVDNEEARKASETFDREASNDVLGKDETTLDEQADENR